MCLAIQCLQAVYNSKQKKNNTTTRLFNQDSTVLVRITISVSPIKQLYRRWYSCIIQVTSVQ